MADKEPRKRKKRKENQKRDESDDAHQPKDSKNHQDRSSSEEPIHDVTHEPSIFAKSVFFILFSLLIVAVGLIFFTLHGVQRDTFDASTEPLSDSPLDGHGELHSAIPDIISSSFDNHQTVLESDEIEPSAVQDVPYNEEPVEEATTVDPSEMHPWAEHIPQEKPEDQNIFNQIYEALQEEFFQDESQDDDHEEDADSHAEADAEGEDFMEDSFFKVDSASNDISDEHGGEDFRVIVEDVEIPAQQNLLNLEPSEVVDESADESWDLKDSETTSEPLKEFPSEDASKDSPSSQSETVDHKIPNSEVQQELLELEDDDDDDDEGDGDDEDEDDDDDLIIEKVLPVDGTFDTYIPETKESSPDQNVLQSSEAGAQPDNLHVPETEDFKIIDWPEDSPRRVDVEESLTVSSADVPLEGSSDPVQVEDVVKSEQVQQDENPLINDASDAREDDDDDDDSPKEEPLAEQDTGADEPAEAISDQQNVVEVENAQQSDESDLHFESSDDTNEYDFLFKEDIEEADRIVEKEPEDSDFYFWRF